MDADTSIRKFPCAQCGGEAEYVPGTGLKCPYCSHVQGEPQNPDQVIEEFDFATYLRHGKRGYAAPTSQNLVCKQCGATSTVAGDAASAKCAFCGSPVVIETASDDAVRPEGVVPFRIDKQAAVTRFRGWVAALWFAPNELRKLAEHDRVVGVYRPYWTYDSATHSWYTGERGEYYYVTEWYTDSQGRRQSRQVRKTRWYPASGQVRKYFDDVLVPAGRELEWETTYNLGDLKPYDGGFLAGWQAERYTIPVEKGWPRAKGIMDGVIDGLVRRDIGGDEQRVHSIRTSYDAIRFKHILLPLYLASYFYRGKSFRFQVNGQNGDVKGQRPWSFWKIFLLVLAILAGIVGIGLIVSAASGGRSRNTQDWEHRRLERYPRREGAPSGWSQNFTPTSMKMPLISMSTSNFSTSASSSVASMVRIR
jgi:DNA-directed RNA polymerase subunit RPC12/RpoP